MPSSNNENGKANNENGNNNNSNNNNDPTNEVANVVSNNNSKSASSAEGTRRVKPGTGKAKSRKEIGFAVNMKHAKKTLNDALGIKSMPPEFNPLIKIMKTSYNSETDKKSAINAYIEKVRKGREDKAAAKSAKKASNASTTVKKPRKAKVANAAPAPTPAGNGAPASANTKSAKRSKRAAPTNKEGKLKENMTAAKKQLNNALGIKSMPPEFNPLVTIMRKSYNSESDKKAAINAHIEKVRKARNDKAATKAAKKNVKGGSRTRKNRRS
jgi:hypothetical protein